MIRKNDKDSWQKLDNSAKIFSLDDKNNMNIFRYSVLLKQDINPMILKKAVMKTLNKLPMFKVKIGTGFFWNYLEYNSKNPLVIKECGMPCEYINLKNNNNYLFKVTYYKNKINIDVLHVLTDGTGAMEMLKTLIYNYLNIRYKLELKNEISDKKVEKYQDLCLKYYNKKYNMAYDFGKAYQLPGRVNLRVNKTYYYIVSVEEFKKICKRLKVTITEYLTAVYIYALYLSFYNKKSNKEINITVPINLRKVFNEETLANFFTYMNVVSNVSGKEKITFNQILKHVHNEFEEKLTEKKINEYLARDVNLGMNLSIRLVPLVIKKLFIKFMGVMVIKSTTSTLSNVGIVQIADRYKKYIDNILVIGKPGRIQKIKCTVCSYDDKLNITVNSNINDKKFHKEFLRILQSSIKQIRIESNMI